MSCGRYKCPSWKTCLVGKLVGALVGELIGAIVGAPVGALVSVLVGALAGRGRGAIVGCRGWRAGGNANFDPGGRWDLAHGRREH